MTEEKSNNDSNHKSTMSVALPRISRQTLLSLALLGVATQLFSSMFSVKVYSSVNVCMSFNSTTEAVSQPTNGINHAIHIDVDVDSSATDDRAPIAASTPPTKTTPSTAASSTSPDYELLARQMYQRHYYHVTKIPYDDLLWFFRGLKQNFRGFMEGFPHFMMMEEKKNGRVRGSFTGQPLTGQAILRVGFKERGEPVNATAIPNLREQHPVASKILFFPDKKTLCQASKFFQKYHNNTSNKPWPHVLVIGLNCDFGALSERIVDVTYPSNPRREQWKQAGCEEQDILDYIDHPQTLAVVTSQFHIYNHPKAHSIPIGALNPGFLRSLQDKLRRKANTNTTKRDQVLAHKPKLVMVNFKEWKLIPGRKILLDHLHSSNFSWANGTHLDLENTYTKTNRTVAQKDFHFGELVNSKFVMAPSGYGLDCYRICEALMAGAIPVIETRNRIDGWRRIFDDLPVLEVDYWENLTPDYMMEGYQQILQKWDTCNWDKLTRHYWVDWLIELAQLTEQEQKSIFKNRNGNYVPMEDYDPEKGDVLVSS